MPVVDDFDDDVASPAELPEIFLVPCDPEEETAVGGRGTNRTQDMV